MSYGHLRHALPILTRVLESGEVDWLNNELDHAAMHSVRCGIIWSIEEPDSFPDLVDVPL